MSNLVITLEVKPTQELMDILKALVSSKGNELSAAPAPVNPQAAPIPSALAATQSAPVIPPAYTYAPTPAVPTPAASAPIAPTTAAPQQAPVNNNSKPVATVPVASTPSYTFDDLARAAAQLMDAGKRQQLLDLLNKFEIQSMQQLPKEGYGEFATALRQIGARI